ncbi:hypothetical protein GE061_009737 [Apolygus lucorum]|uniref:Transglutaminase N-terminal domain-containing protein n=1 Tax=Apolygus lucorum TaxID=248454 RepID=A0A6A4JYP4_APOLU|nr:hypothetical protein GE061_009737 [Apolygus lucorum]
MSLSLRRPTLTNVPSPTDYDLLRDAVPISKFVNEDTDVPLSVSSLNFNIERNGLQHRTYNYAFMKDPEKHVLIVRRGQPFRITVGLSRKFCQRDYITLLFYNKDLCNTTKGTESDGSTSMYQRVKVVTLRSTFGSKTKIVVPVIATSHYSIKSTSKWDAVCDFVGNDSIQVLVQAADDCIVGRWHMSICIEQDGVISWFHDPKKTTIYVIFNYACRGDEVYLENPTERVEYVDETLGMVFVGCQHHVMVNFWSFGQFDSSVLELAMKIMLTTDQILDMADRGRPTKVAQIIANAVLETDKFFKNGNKHAEDSWSSASRVISEYMRKKKPIVYYEQRTIVAVLTSIFRSLGIPARPVSGYNLATGVFSIISFQPGQQNKSDQQEFLVEDLKVFFPWVEIFVLRKDLGDVQRGWQAVSGGGPASVAAIQECDYVMDYKTLVFCNQLNNTFTYFHVNKQFDSIVPLNEVPGRLGAIITTKKAGVGAFGFVIIEKNYRSTHEHLNDAYKNGFGTEYRRILEAHVTTHATVANKFVGKKLHNLSFQLTPIRSILLGEAIPINLYAVTSDQTKEWEAYATVYVFSVSPEGKLLKKVKQASMKLLQMVEGGSGKLTVPYSEYSSKLQINGMFKVIAVVWVTGMSEGYFLVDEFFIISIPPPQLLVSQNALTVSLTNTLPIPMKNVSVMLYELGDSTPNVKLKIPMLVKTYREMGGHG